LIGKFNHFVMYPNLVCSEQPTGKKYCNFGRRDAIGQID